MEITDITYFHRTPKMSFMKAWSNFLVNQPTEIPLNILSSPHFTAEDKIVLSVIDSYLDFIPNSTVVNGIARVNIDVLAITLHSTSAVISHSIHHIQKIEHQINNNHKQENNMI